MLATKLTEKISDTCNAKEKYQSILKKKNAKLMKRTKVITHQQKPRESPNIIDIKSVTIEHQKNSYKLSKTIKQVRRFLKYLVVAKNLMALYIARQ